MARDAREWYYKSNEQEMGPVSAQELKKLADYGILKPTDRVWKEGMPDWKSASKARGLFPADVEPSSPPEQPISPSFDNNLVNEGYESGPKPDRRSMRVPEAIGTIGGAVPEALGVVDSLFAMFFDFGFKRYLTPVLVRIIWTLQVVVVLLSLLFFVSVSLFASSSRPAIPEFHQENMDWSRPGAGSKVSTPSQSVEKPSELLQAIKVVMYWGILFGILFLIALLFLIYCRVCAEMIIVLFNISIDLKKLYEATANKSA